MKNLLQLFLKVECKFNWKCQINIKYTTDSNQMINKLNTWKFVLNWITEMTTQRAAVVHFLFVISEKTPKRFSSSKRWLDTMKHFGIYTFYPHNIINNQV